MPVIVGSDMRGRGWRAWLVGPALRIKQVLRRFVLKHWVCKAGYAMGTGAAAEDYFKDIGCTGPSGKGFFGVRAQDPTAWSAASGLRLVYVGRLIKTEEYR